MGVAAWIGTIVFGLMALAAVGAVAFLVVNGFTSWRRRREDARVPDRLPQPLDGDLQDPQFIGTPHNDGSSGANEAHGTIIAVIGTGAVPFGSTRSPMSPGGGAPPRR